MSYINFLLTNFRWLLVGFLLCLTSSYGQTFFISIFAGEIRSEFGLSHTAWGWIYAAGTTSSAIAMVWAGGLTDHFRVRTLAPIVLVSLAIACLAMSAIPSASLLVVVIFALRFSGQGMATHTSMVAMSRWFQATRGRALSIASLGNSFGNAILPLIFVSLMTYFSWRQLWILAAALAVILIPLLLRLLREERTPQSISGSYSSAGMNSRHWNRKDMFKHWLIWFCIPLVTASPALITVFFFQQVPLAEAKNWTLTNLVSLFPWLTFGSISFTFAAGIAVDKWGAGRLLPLIPLPLAFGFFTIAATSTLLMAAIGLVLIGIGMGLQATIVSAFWSEHYGTRHIGSIKSAVMAMSVFSSAIGPALSGILLDMDITMETQLFAYSGYFLICASLAYIATRRARPLLTQTP
jgi:MFS family permease